MGDLTVMIVDGGARGHVLSEAYERSSKVKKIIVAPGNDFIGWNRKKEVIIASEGKLKDPESLVAVAKKYKPDIVDVAQDDALALGTVDRLKEEGFDAFGPTAAAAQVEANKIWARKFMTRHDIPTPEYHVFDMGQRDNELAATGFLQGAYTPNGRFGPNPVFYVKASGLAAGKGAIKVTNLEEGIAAIEEMAKIKGGAGKRFLIEDGMPGEELSTYTFCDGKTAKMTKSAQDNKTQLEYEQGPNTGGMGAIAPALVVAENNLFGSIQDLSSRTVEGMAAEGMPYVGILYGGWMVTGEGLKNVEFNARWGDPEVQVVVPGIKTDMVDIVTACLNGRLKDVNIEEDNLTRVCLVGAIRNYPLSSTPKDKRIFGLEEAMAIPGVSVYGAGIVVMDNKFFSDGGRLFSVVAEGNGILEARKLAYMAMGCIHIDGNNLRYRTDIGSRDVGRALRGK